MAQKKKTKKKKQIIHILFNLTQRIGGKRILILASILAEIQAAT